MRLVSLELAQYRNFGELFLEFSGDSDIAVLFGKNGIGKTNILESIYLLALAKTFRFQESHSLIQEGAEFYRVKGELSAMHSVFGLEVFHQMAPLDRKVFKMNDVKRNVRDFVGNALVILFSPEDVNIVYLSPSYRRRYFDRVLSQIDIMYLDNLVKYKRIIRQRNHLLKSMRENNAKREELVFWDEELIRVGMDIVRARTELTDYFSTVMGQQYEHISGRKHDFRLHYRSNMKDKSHEELRTDLENRIQRDIALESTSLGPHRDDLEFYLDDQAIQHFCSRGEIRSVIIALKLIELKYLREKKKDEPLLLLDDVFSELDITRRKLLLDAFDGTQVIITTTEKNIIEGDNIQVIDVEKIKSVKSVIS